MSWRRRNRYAGEHYTKKGIKVRSKLEKRVLEDLDKRGAEYEYEPRTFKWKERIAGGVCSKCGGKKVYKRRTYLPDLILGNSIVVEIKGRFTARDRKLLQGVRESNGGLELRLVFDRDNKISVGSKTRYSDWAAKFKFKAGFKGVVPQSWLDEPKPTESK